MLNQNPDYFIQYDTKYYYKIGDGESAREFWFHTPSAVNPDASYKFGIIGKVILLRAKTQTSLTSAF